MRYVILLATSFVALLLSFGYAKKSLTRDGEYHASLYFIGLNVTNVHIVTNMHNSDFISHSYLKSASLSETAKFISKGRFIDDAADGSYSISYVMEEENSPKILDPNKARFYLDMVGRTGVDVEEKIRMIYHDQVISLFDMNRNGNVIMYSKKH